jgi:4-cresol dehydrogenase (hydroxylating)
VQAIVRAANEHRFALYPVSRGRNWGLGSRVPVHDGNVVLDLHRLDHVVEFNEELSYVTVEPGVTFGQIVEFLKSRGSQLYMPVIGGPPDASLVANTLQRGDGLGPLGDHCRHCCALEAVLGTGEVLKTGFAPFGASLAESLSADGLGPSLDGLLFQSNLGIVTRMTLWLPRRPASFQGVVFTVKDDALLPQLMTALRELQQAGVLQPSSCALWNAYKYLAAFQQYPFRDHGEVYDPPSGVLAHLPRAMEGTRWIGLAGLYSASRAHARADRHAVKHSLKGLTARLAIIGSASVRMLRWTAPFASDMLGMDVQSMLRLLYSESPFLGNPTRFSLASVYWRKRAPRPADMHPDRDRCGLHWVCTAVPFDGDHVRRHASIVEEVAFAHGLEPNLSYTNPNERLLKSFAVITFDRDVGDEEARARSCHDQMMRKLQDAGYPALRLGIQSMTATAPSEGCHLRQLQRLKALFDPNDVIAPGAYDFRHRWEPEPALDVSSQ